MHRDSKRQLARSSVMFSPSLHLHETAEFYGNEFMTTLLSEEAVNYVFYELLQHESFEHIVVGS